MPKSVMLSKNESKSVNTKKRALEVPINSGPLFMYIGETSRSAYERGHEHLKDLEFKRGKSHYLRHAVEHHPTVPPESLKFCMKILSCHKSAFERQIREAVMIDINAGPNLMNSKLEYSRCAIPKMSINLGNNKNQEDPLITKEKSTLEKIKMLYKSENKRTEIETHSEIPNKRARIEDQIIEGDYENDGQTNQEIETLSLVSPNFNHSNKKSKNKDNSNLGTASKVAKSIVPKVKKVPRKKIKLKLSPVKKSSVPKLGTEKRSPAPILATEKRSTNPILAAENGSPDPKLDAENGSTDAETGYMSNCVKSKSISGLHKELVSSPSLKTVKVKALIMNFENNVTNFHQGPKKESLSDAFVTLMNSKGYTQKKTPKRKPKRLLSENTTGKKDTVMDNWLKKF